MQYILKFEWKIRSLNPKFWNLNAKKEITIIKWEFAYSENNVSDIETSALPWTWPLIAKKSS